MVKLKKMLLSFVFVGGCVLHLYGMKDPEKTLITFDSGFEPLNNLFRNNIKKVKENNLASDFLNEYENNSYAWLENVENILPMYDKDNIFVKKLIHCLVLSEIIQENLTDYNYDQAISFQGKIKLSCFLGYSLEEEKELRFAEFCKKIIENCFSEDDLKNCGNNVLYSLYDRYVYNNENSDENSSNQENNNDAHGDDLPNFYPYFYNNEGGNKKINIAIQAYLEKKITLSQMCDLLVGLISEEGKVTYGKELSDIQINYLANELKCKHTLLDIRNAALLL